MDRSSAQAFWVAAPGRGEIRSETLPKPGADDVLVRALYGGVSRGTESLVFAGSVPESQRQAMRAPFQAGDFPAPVKYGYVNVGRVESGPAALTGRTVFCLHPHQSAYVVPADAVVPVPDTVPAERAVLAANMETALNGLWDAGPRIGDRIAVIGAGVTGCLVAYLASRIHGAEVQLIDINPDRTSIAKQLGVPFAVPASAAEDCDLVVHVSGAPAGLVTALSLAGFEATVLEMSWYGDRTVELPLGEAFHAKRLDLRSSQVGAIAPAQRPRWNHRRRMSLALSLLTDPVLDCLISGECGFAALPETMKALAAGAGSVLCHRIRYHD